MHLQDTFQKEQQGRTGTETLPWITKPGFLFGQGLWRRVRVGVLQECGEKADFPLVTNKRHKCQTFNSSFIFFLIQGGPSPNPQM